MTFNQYSLASILAHVAWHSAIACHGVVCVCVCFMWLSLILRCRCLDLIIIISAHYGNDCLFVRLMVDAARARSVH